MATRTKLLIAATVTVAAVLSTIIFLRQTTKNSSQGLRAKSLTLRVDNIPTDQADDFDRNLYDIIEHDVTLKAAVTKTADRSLTPKDKHSTCATIVFQTSLSAKDLSARLKRAGISYPYRYTSEFDGITPLHDDQNVADVDIIAVPGLGSHALSSWKSPTGDDVWLRDFLPNDIPGIRVLLYGYDTVRPGSLSKQSIEDLGSALLEQVIAFRARDGTSLRPIVLIGHSLGGLLIKECDKTGQWRRTGPPSLLVTEKPTTSIGLVAIADEDNTALNAGHPGLVKFEHNAQGNYSIVRERLKRLAEANRDRYCDSSEEEEDEEEDIPAIIQFRWEHALLADHMAKLFNLPIPNSQTCILWDSRAWKFKVEPTKPSFEDNHSNIWHQFGGNFLLAPHKYPGPFFNRFQYYLTAAVTEANLSEKHTSAMVDRLKVYMQVAKDFDAKRAIQGPEANKSGHNWITSTGRDIRRSLLSE